MKYILSIVKGRSWRQAGFTLIELLVVMGVIGTLAAGLVMVMNPAGQLDKARDAERKSDLNQLQRALEIYYDDYNRYPDTLSELNSPSASYIEQIPTDPSTELEYQYVADSPAFQKYWIYAHLESQNDPQACDPEDSSVNCPNAVENACGEDEDNSACNFGVASPNASP